MAFGVWTGATSIKVLVASGRVHISAHPVISPGANGDYMCLKIHQLGEGTKP